MRYLLVPVALLLAGCATNPAPPAAVDTKAAEEAIRKADADWVKAAQTGKVDAWMAFYSSDAAVLPPNEKLATARADIEKSVAGLLGLPKLQIKWEPTKIEVAQSGELGYMYGAYDLSFEDKGKTVSDKGKNLEIWKKQEDGSWKCIVDTWNSDLPAAPPPQ